MKNNQEVEVFNDEMVAEQIPTEGGIISPVAMDGDIVELAQTITQKVEAAKKIRGALLGLAQSGDWVVFGDGEKAKATLGYAGAMRIGSTLGVSFLNFSANKETWEDEKGRAYRWEFECDAVFRAQTIRVYGRASSRDVFFGKAHGEFKALSDVDEGNIKMAARRACMKEGVRALFGLHSMNPEDLKQMGVKLESANSYTFKSNAKKAEDASETAEVTGVVSEVKIKEGSSPKGQWKQFGVILDGTLYKTFSATYGSIAQTSKAEKKPVKISFASGQYGNDIKSLELVS